MSNIKSITCQFCAEQIPVTIKEVDTSGNAMERIAEKLKYAHLCVGAMNDLSGAEDRAIARIEEIFNPLNEHGVARYLRGLERRIEALVETRKKSPPCSYHLLTGEDCVHPAFDGWRVVGEK